GAESASEPVPVLLTAIVRDPASRAAAPTRTAFRRGTGLVKGTPVSFRFTNLPQQMCALTNCYVNAFCSAVQYDSSLESVKCVGIENIIGSLGSPCLCPHGEPSQSPSRTGIHTRMAVGPLRAHS